MDKLLTLGIDPWAIVVYLGNTGLVIVILTLLVYKPVIKILDKRREVISNSMDEAANLQSAFEKKLAETERQTKEAEEKFRDELAKLKAYTEEKRKELFAEMEQARTAMLNKTEEEIRERKAGLLKDAEKDIKLLMAKIILDIVENKVPENVVEESIQSGWKKYSH